MSKSMYQCISYVRVCEIYARTHQVFAEHVDVGVWLRFSLSLSSGKVGYWWGFSGIQWDDKPLNGISYDIIPSGNDCYIDVESMAIDISWVFPVKMVMFHSFLLVYQSVWITTYFLVNAPSNDAKLRKTWFSKSSQFPGSSSDIPWRQLFRLLYTCKRT